MTFPTRHAPRPLGDPVVPPSRPLAACLTPTRSGFPRTPHVTRRVDAGVVACTLCGSAWSVGRSVRSPFVEAQLVEREWRRRAVVVKSAVVDHYRKPFLEWFDLAALVDVVRWLWRERPYLSVAALAVFWLAVIATRLARVA